MKSVAGLALAGYLLVLSGCGSEACSNLPVCLNPPPSEAQPHGGVQSGVVELSPGESRDATLTIERMGVPADEPLHLLALDPKARGVSVLAVSRDGNLTLTGDTRPFVGNTVVLTLKAAADAPVSSTLYQLSVAIRKQSTKYETSGFLSVEAFVR